MLALTAHKDEWIVVRDAFGDEVVRFKINDKYDRPKNAPLILQLASRSIEVTREPAFRREGK